MRQSPCSGCRDRTITCHGFCTEYKKWLDEYHEMAKALREERINPRRITRDSIKRWLSNLKRVRMD